MSVQDLNTLHFVTSCTALLFCPKAETPDDALSSTTDMAKFLSVEQRHSLRGQARVNSDLVEVCTSPKFVVRPKNNTFRVTEGRNVHFEAKLEPMTDPNLQVEWLLDGKPIIVGHRFKLTFGQSWFLENGMFVCVSQVSTHP